MLKGYARVYGGEENRQDPKLKSICGDNIKYPLVKKARQTETDTYSESLSA